MVGGRRTKKNPTKEMRGLQDDIQKQMATTQRATTNKKQKNPAI